MFHEARPLIRLITSLTERCGGMDTNIWTCYVDKTPLMIVPLRQFFAYLPRDFQKIYRNLFFQLFKTKFGNPNNTILMMKNRVFAPVVLKLFV